MNKPDAKPDEWLHYCRIAKNAAFAALCRAESALNDARVEERGRRAKFETAVKDLKQAEKESNES